MAEAKKQEESVKKTKDITEELKHEKIVPNKEQLKTTDIKGKAYVEVNERIRYFRETYPEWSLISDIVSLEDGVCLMQATVLDEKREVRATGYAQEKEQSSYINKTSFIENCETSAWGRALGNLGIGVDTSIASADEVINAVVNQKKQENKQHQAKRDVKPKEKTKLEKSRDVLTKLCTDLVQAAPDKRNDVTNILISNTPDSNKKGLISKMTQAQIEKITPLITAIKEKK